MDFVKISPLSYRILIKDVPHDMVNVNGKDIPVFSLMKGHSLDLFLCKKFHHKVKESKKLDRIIGIPTDSCEDTSAIGYFLHMIHMDKMYKFVETLLIAEVNASHAVDIFRSIYDITDEDWERDTMTRMWRKYLNKRKNNKKWTYHLTDTQQKRTSKLSPIKKVRISEVKEKLSSALSAQIHTLISTKHKVDTDKILALERQILYQGGYNIANIAKQYKVTPAAISLQLNKYNLLPTKAG